MINFVSVVERTLHLQLQDVTRFRTPISIFAAVVVFSGVRIAGITSSTSLSESTLATTLRSALTKSTNSEGVRILNSVFDIFTRALSTLSLRMRIHVGVPIQWRQMFSVGHGRPRNDETYAMPRAEQKYWRIAGRYHHRLYSGNDPTPAPSAASRDVVAVPLVTYYTPRLLPLYRNHSGRTRASRETDADALEGRVSPRTFCKWHRMVFQDVYHPTIAQAATQMRYYSNRDLREIQRIARLVPDEQVFGSTGRGSRKAKAKATTKYSEMWSSWLENKGVDLVIVFE